MFRNAWIAVASVPLVLLGAPYVYRSLTESEATITVRDKFATKNGSIQYFLIDENCNQYLISIDKNNGFHVIKYGGKYKIKYYGVRQSLLGTYPTIIYLEEIQAITSPTLVSEHRVAPQPIPQQTILQQPSLQQINIDSSRVQALDNRYSTIEADIQNLKKRVEKLQ